MFLVNRLFGNAASPSPELATIEEGRLFLVRADAIKGNRECIFIDASISIRRTTYDYNYQLVVTRTFQEGEEQLLEEDAENSDERAFLLDPTLFLSFGQSVDSAADSQGYSFMWLDPEADDEFEFVLASSAKADLERAQEFEKLAWKCMWERRERRAFPTDKAEAARIDATLEDDFKVERTQPKRDKTPLFRESSPTASTSSADRRTSRSQTADSADEVADMLAKTTISPKTTPRSSATKGKQKAVALEAPADVLEVPRPPQPTTRLPDTAATELVKINAELHLYDRATGLFMLQEKTVEASVHRTASGFWLLVERPQKQGVWVSTGIENDMVINFSERESAMVFNFSLEEGSQQGQVYTWLLRFANESDFNRMQESVSQAIFEGKWGSGAWKMLKDDERNYQKTAYIEDAEMYGIDEAPPQEDAEEEEEESEEEETEEEESDEDERDKPQRKAKNSLLSVGYKDQLSFVVQGDMIGVFKQQQDGGKKLKFMTSIVNLTTPDGKAEFTPAKAMLHNQDTSMILQNPLAPGSLYRLDLNTGKVVDEYKVSDDFAVKSYLPDSKFAQTTQQQTFIGLSNNGVFRIDPRLAGSKLVDSEFKQYATKNDFSVATTTEAGKLAVASNKGDIRLFDKLGKIAKTALPALGDPILGIDVTADGRWVIATCKTYLLLIDTLIPEGAGRYGGSSGFDRSFPADAKPTPKRLQLKPEHVAYMKELSKEGVSFTPAKFNTGLGTEEKTIVTSTGPFVVAWNFRHVKAGDYTRYTLRRFTDTVIADQFTFGGDRNIVVTLPGEVFMEQKKKLKAPTRESIAQIVKTWD